MLRVFLNHKHVSILLERMVILFCFVIITDGSRVLYRLTPSRTFYFFRLISSRAQRRSTSYRQLRRIAATFTTF